MLFPITLRSDKGSELTHEELDGNFAELDLRTGPGWRDLVSPIGTAGVPNVNAPNKVAFGPNHTPQREEFAFDLNDYCFCEPFHVNHDVKPGGDAYLHVHWSTQGVQTFNVVWELSFLRALGHSQGAFDVVAVKTLTQAAHPTPWQHQIIEVGAGDLITLFEPDELILVTLRRLTNGGTNVTDNVFGLMVDLHYESDRNATPNKVPDFYA